MGWKPNLSDYVVWRTEWDSRPPFLCMSILLHHLDRIFKSHLTTSYTWMEHHGTTRLSPRRSDIDLCLLRLTFQTVFHGVWCERNNMKHNNTYHTALELIQTKIIWNRVSSLRFRNATFYSKMMIRWLERINRIVSEVLLLSQIIFLVCNLTKFAVL